MEQTRERKPRKTYSKIATISHSTKPVTLNPFDIVDGNIDSSHNPCSHSDNQCMSAPKFKSFSHMFHSIIPPQLLFDVLEQVCVKREEYYIFNLLAFRSLQYRNLYPEFASKILPYYRNHYTTFVTKPLTYSSFVVILRHICKMNNIRFDTKANYSSPGYNIDYYVYSHTRISIHSSSNPSSETSVFVSLTTGSI